MAQYEVARNMTPPSRYSISMLHVSVGVRETICCRCKSVIKGFELEYFRSLVLESTAMVDQILYQL